MIATTGDAVVYCTQFYMFTMRSDDEHTHSDENSIMLCAAASLSRIYHCRIFIPPTYIHMEALAEAKELCDG